MGAKFRLHGKVKVAYSELALCQNPRVGRRGRAAIPRSIQGIPHRDQPRPNGSKRPSWPHMLSIFERDSSHVEPWYFCANKEDIGHGFDTITHVL